MVPPRVSRQYGNMAVRSMVAWPRDGLLGKGLEGVGLPLS